MEDLTKHYLISGRVQGVGYRAFTRRRAEELKLKGWVRNLKDGRVEAVAQGSDDGLNAFAKSLWQGASHGQVDNVSVNEPATVEDLSNGFEVRKDGSEPCC